MNGEIHGTGEGDLFLSGRIKIGKSEPIDQPTLLSFIKSGKHGKCNFKDVTIDDIQHLQRGDKLRLINDKFLLKDLFKKGRISQVEHEYNYIQECLGNEVIILETDKEDNMTPIMIEPYGIWIPLELVESVVFIRKRDIKI